MSNKVLSMTNNQIHGPGGAAKLLGINPSTLRGRMGKFRTPDLRDLGLRRGVASLRFTTHP
jgi:hypothetical protein